MRPELTYRGALNILGRYDRPRLDALNRILGGAILLSPLAGTASLAGGLAALWGWIDQKNEAIGIVRHLLNTSQSHAKKTGGLPRQQVIVSAHTALVGAAFFDSLKAAIGENEYKALELTKNEILALSIDQIDDSDIGDDFVERLYASRTPIPSTHRSFEYICRNDLRQHYIALADSTLHFLKGLAAWRPENSSAHSTAVSAQQLTDAAIDRYATYYRRLAVDAPEFRVWAILNEHGATHHDVTEIGSKIDNVLQAQTRALANTEQLLGLIVGAQQPSVESARYVVHRLNRSTLKDPIAPAESQHMRDIVFPVIDEIYVNPRFQAATFGPASMPSMDEWWTAFPVRKDLDLFLAGYFMSHESTETPLLILGHPGGGKSLVTKVLAARLPVESYTVVRVALRKVDANVPIYMQIQKALNDTTHGRVEWAQLTDEAIETIRVVILDGLDELIQATKNDRSGYLHEVAEFQRRETDLNRPVAIVVTSRTIVSDHIRIPFESTIVRIREFDDQQVERWLHVWRRANPQITRYQRLELQLTPRYNALAAQPLLLMMLAIYAGDAAAAPLDARTSRGALYGMLLRSFIQRELSKVTWFNRNDSDAALSDQFWRLAIAAFGMFNRGRQSISDAELGSDLRALTEQFVASEGRDADSAQIGQRTIGQFFFIHISEADGHRSSDVQRSYEFLHSTFGEYLIARHILEILERMASAPRYGSYYSASIDDSHLYALLSHQPLTMRRSTLSFLRDSSRELPTDELNKIHTTLASLIGVARRRLPGSKYDNYRPTPVDRVRELAAYTANLVLIRVYFTVAVVGVTFEELFSKEDCSEGDWRSLVRLWRAGLDATAWDSIVETIVADNDRVVQRVAGIRGLPHEFHELGYAQLASESDLALELRAGRAAAGQLYLASEDGVSHQLYCYLVFSVLHGLPSAEFEDSVDSIVAGIQPYGGLGEAASLGKSRELAPNLIVSYLATHASKLSSLESRASFLF